MSTDGRYAGLLYANPSFTEGMARILDFGDTLTEYNYSRSAEEADANAIRSDWRAIADDLERSIAEIREQQNERT